MANKINFLVPALSTTFVLMKASTFEHGLEFLFALTLVSATLAAGLHFVNSRKEAAEPRPLPIRLPIELPRAR